MKMHWGCSVVGNACGLDESQLTCLNPNIARYWEATHALLCLLALHVGDVTILALLQNSV